MICIHLKNTDPYFCLAAEEYLLKNFDEDIFMLWQSNNTVVVGKHQNLMAEINYPYTRENNITLARRISGGGTVFHDKGNVNFTFIKNVNSPAEVSFEMFTQPVRKALASLGVIAETTGRNDLVVNSKKISGNAEHIYKNRVLHHGTLLFNSDLENLGNSIKVVAGKYQSKAIQSNRSKVANISTFLNQELSIDEFVSFLLDFQLKRHENTEYVLSEYDIQLIRKLVKEKFTTPQWIFGYSPLYSFQNEKLVNNKNIDIGLNVKKGIIQECNISGNYFLKAEAEKVSSGLLNKMHVYEEVRQVLNKFSQKISDEVIYSFF